MNRTPGLDPSQTALLLMDFQPDIVSSLEDPKALLELASSARRQVRELGVRIVYVRVAFTAQDLAGISVKNKSFARLTAGERLVDGTPGAAVHPELRPEAGDVVVTKTRIGAFSTTNLAGHLRARGIDTLVLAGVSTSGVVLSTLRDAADRDYRLLVLADCCADSDPEVHRVLTEKVFPRQADVIDVAELLGRLGGA